MQRAVYLMSGGFFMEVPTLKIGKDTLSNDHGA
jgi:hypothetical protein